MRKNIGDKGSGSFTNRCVQGLVRAYKREYELISDDIYYSLMLEREYPDLSAIFESLAMKSLEIFKKLGVLLIDMGVDPRLNLRVVQTRETISDIQDISGDDIDRILLSLIEKERRGMAGFDSIMCFEDDSERLNKLSRITSEKAEKLSFLERIMRS